MAITLLLGALALLCLLFVGQVARQLRARPTRPKAETMALSFIANFFDTLGIGSFAPSTAYFRFRRMVPDELIPPTLIVGYSAATATEAFVFINVITVSPTLLFACVVAMSIGCALGVAVAPRLPVQLIRFTIGIGLLIAAVAAVASNLGITPPSGAATALPLAAFAVAVIASLVMGVLLNLGIGNFAPSLIIFSLLGLDPHAAFPIMMGSAAFPLVTSGVTILKSRPLDMSVVSGMLIGGVPAVLLAAFIVKSLPLAALRWVVIAVVTYAAVVMLHAALTQRRVRFDSEPLVDSLP